MSIIVSHTSALQVFAQCAAAGNLPKPGRTPLRVSAPNSGEMHRVERLFPQLEMPYDILITAREQRRWAPQVRNHLVVNEIPYGCTCQVDEGVYVVSPEYNFILLASKMPLIQHIRLGFALLGTYGLCEWGFNDEVLDMDEPFCTYKRLREIVGKVENVNGIKQSRRAVRHLLPNSGSPMETTFGITMSLPRSLGGQAVRNLELNYEIPLNKAQRRSAGKSFYRIDAVRRDLGIGFEYLGEESHAGMVRGVSDLRRESILQAMDYQVHGVTKSQVTNLAELIRFARIIYKAEGRQFRKPSDSQIRSMISLLETLYPWTRYSG